MRAGNELSSAGSRALALSGGRTRGFEIRCVSSAAYTSIIIIILLLYYYVYLEKND